MLENQLQSQVQEGDKIYLRAGTETLFAIYRGIVTEVEKGGIWLTEDNEKTEEFVSFAEVLDWAIE